MDKHFRDNISSLANHVASAAGFLREADVDLRDVQKDLGQLKKLKPPTEADTYPSIMVPDAIRDPRGEESDIHYRLRGVLKSLDASTSSIASLRIAIQQTLGE